MQEENTMARKKKKRGFIYKFLMGGFWKTTAFSAEDEILTLFYNASYVYRSTVKITHVSHNQMDERRPCKGH
jgi:hypothetical protein